MNQQKLNKPVLLVVGATGSIGRYVVDVGSAAGYQVRALSRSKGNPNELPADATWVKGDITQPDSLEDAVAGVDCIVMTHGTYGDPKAAARVDYGAVRNVLTALKGRQARIALMSTIGATDRKGSHDWKRRGERLLRVSGLPYTIVRPGWFDYNQPNQHQLLMLQGDTRLTGTPRDGVISRLQIAEVLVGSLSSDAAIRKTLELHAEIGEAQDSLDPLFAELDRDLPAALDGVHDKANMPFEQEPADIRQELEAVRASFTS